VAEPCARIADVTTGELSPRLDSLLARAVNGGRYIRHGLAAVATGDGTWSWQGAHGVLDPEGTPATTVSRYPVASVTKLYTAVVVMRLGEHGRVRLTDRVVDILSPEVTTGLHVLGGLDRTAEITVEHLLGHTSGLADYYEEGPAGEPSAQARLLAGEDAPMPFEEVLSVVRSLDPHFPPQSVDAPKRKARYADTNYQLLGAIIELVCGQPLHAVFDSTLFGPLGLDATSSYPHPPRNGASAEPDARVWAKDVVLHPEGALTFQKADGGIISTLGDQVRFMQALVGGEVFEDPATWPRMYERCSRVFFPVDYGLGVMRYAPSRLMSPLFPIPAIVGHSGSTATWLFHCPELGVVLAGTFDVAQPPLPFRFLPKVLRAVAQHR
jgi:D-alanyl-D-alanine carboxypeptidase